METWSIVDSFLSLVEGLKTKWDTPLASPAKRGSTPLDSPKGEKGDNKYGKYRRARRVPKSTIPQHFMRGV